MLSLTLLPQDEYQWHGNNNPFPAIFPSGENKYPLYHQWRTYNAEAPLIVNTFNTGTGKTKAALLRLLKRVEQRQGRINATRDNVLLIAPTNELLLQHATDAEDFCQKNELLYHVISITAELIEEYMTRYKEQLQFGEERVRKSWVFHYILRDASLVDRDTSKSPAIYVVNPDIFYYITYFCYNRFDRGTLFEDINHVNYFIIDEFHYYDPKQLAAFLFFIKFSHFCGYIDNASKQRQFCILTATPRPQVDDYLRGLGIAIDWIVPTELRQVPAADQKFLVPTRALAPVELHVYHTEELQEGEQSGGLLALVRKKCAKLRSFIYEQEWDGAIIANSLGMLNTIHQELKLTSTIKEDDMGRITGPEKRTSRLQAKERRLILATPTVDIGYNFTRSVEKYRQNIDFLFIDAYAGDELIQRVGRAGRVLGKPEQEHTSIVFAVVDPETYKLLQPYEGQDLAREQLSTLAAQMPRKNDLYAYIRTGAIFEVFRPLSFIRQGMDNDQRKFLDDFLEQLQCYFLNTGKKPAKPVASATMLAHMRTLTEREEVYQNIHQVPERAFEVCYLWFSNHDVDEKREDPLVQQCLNAFEKRLEHAYKQSTDFGSTADERTQWLQHDLATYYKDRARFSFRDSFQPPLALIYDRNHLHANADVSSYNAMHILKYYHLSLCDTLDAWQQDTSQFKLPDNGHEAVMFCQLKKIRDTPLRLGLKLNARQHYYTQDQWEKHWAYQVTALYGLEIVVENDQSGLKNELRDMLKTRFVPAFVCLDGPSSHTNTQLRRLREKARFYPYRLTIDFRDRQDVVYNVILGSMAFHVCAELPFWAMQKDRRKTQLEDNEVIIC